METKTEQRPASVETSAVTETAKSTVAKKKSPERAAKASSAEKKTQTVRSTRKTGQKASTAKNEKATDAAPIGTPDIKEKPLTEKDRPIEPSVSSEEGSASALKKPTAKKTSRSSAKSAKKETPIDEKAPVETEKTAEEKSEEKQPEAPEKEKKGSTKKTSAKKAATTEKKTVGKTEKAPEPVKEPEVEASSPSNKPTEKSEQKPVKKATRPTKKAAEKTVKTDEKKKSEKKSEQSTKEITEKVTLSAPSAPSIEEKLEAMAKKAKKVDHTEEPMTVVEQLTAEIPAEAPAAVLEAEEKIVPHEEKNEEKEEPAKVASAFVQEAKEETVDVSGTPPETFVFYSPSQLAAMEVEAELQKAFEEVTVQNTALESSEPDTESDEDPKLKDAIEAVLTAGKASTSLIQRRVGVGYGRSARLLDRMEELGIVSIANGAKPRTILISKEEALSRFGVEMKDAEEPESSPENEPFDLFALDQPTAIPVAEEPKEIEPDTAHESETKTEKTLRPERRSSSRRSDPHEREVMDKDLARSSLVAVLEASAELERRALIEETMQRIPLSDEERQDNHPTSLSNRVRSVIGSVLAEELVRGTIVAVGRKLTLPKKEETVSDETAENKAPEFAATLDIEIDFDGDVKDGTASEEKQEKPLSPIDEDGEDEPFMDEEPVLKTPLAASVPSVDATVAPATVGVRETSIRRTRQSRAERRPSQVQGVSAVLITEDELERVMLNALRRNSATKADLLAVLKRTYVDPNRFSKEEENRIYTVAGNVLQKLVNRGTLQNNDGRYLQKPSQRVLNPGRAPGASFTGNVETRFITELNRQSGDFFEQFAARLLEKYFEMSNIRVDASYVVGGSDDNGIDIMLETTDWLGYKERVFVQAKKRATQPVTLKEVREFYGALCAEEGTRGVFITTSSFCMEASKMIGKIRNLIAIDKRKLFALAEHCEVGLVRDEEGRLLLDENLFLDYDV